MNSLVQQQKRTIINANIPDKRPSAHALMPSSLMLLLVLMIHGSCQLKAQVSHVKSEVFQIDSGPMVGWNTETTASIWVRTKRECTVAIRFWPDSKPARHQMSRTVLSRQSNDLCVHIPIRELLPGTLFRFEVLLQGQVAKTPHMLQFRTQPHWRYRAPPPDLTVAIGSCSYVNDETVDRPGAPYGGNPRIYRSIHAAKPHAMLWLGDNVYFRAPDWSSEFGMQRRYSHDRRIPAMQGLLGSVHNFAIWDDHDFGSNNSDRSFPLREAALRTFQLYWPGPQYGQLGIPGIFSRYSWGDIEFFCLDNRYHRTPNNAPDALKKVMFGKAQMDWLLDGLTSSRATFKIVVGGNQMLNPMIPYEAWGHCAAEKARVLKEISKRKIQGLLFLSGDRHHTELIRIDRPNSYPLYDYTSSPLLSSPNRKLGEELVNPTRVSGTLVNQVRNFGLLRFTGKGQSRSVTLSAHDIDGAELWKHTIEASALR